ncbi:hypothetical protein [Arthrobacter sp. Soil736]|uniref:hypothetical protein n=1 Tax=Arthrobacter sp. Soil736 TaxID=1736395 RepID=UPI000B1FDC0A|nr:hypothetical protein [Arthrobacter sp. Soil736]
MSATSPVARHPHVSAWNLSRRFTAGVVGGVAGGLVFGLLMALMGMLPMVASLVGSSSAWAGFGIHMVISVLIGLGLTLPFAGLLRTYRRSVLVGLGYGALWWVLGALTIMPAILGMPLFLVNVMSGMSLVGHLLYGATLALVAVRVLKGRA